MVDLAENMLEQSRYVRSREVIAIVAGTRTKSGSTNFLRLHVMGEHSLETVPYAPPLEPEVASVESSAIPAPKTKRSTKRK
jgi:pyruvate kinase